MKRKHAGSLTTVMEAIAPEGAAISVITYGEMMEGVLFDRKGQPALNFQRWERFIEPFDVLNVTQGIAEVWASVRGLLRSRGLLILDNDLIIASTALHLDLTVVTLNKRDFGRVDGLSLFIPELPERV